MQLYRIFNKSWILGKFYNIFIKSLCKKKVRGIAKEISFRKTIYVFDSSTHKLLDKINCVSKALKYAKINYYTLKSLIENGKPFNGKIYSYKDKL